MHGFLMLQEKIRRGEPPAYLEEVGSTESKQRYEAWREEQLAKQPKGATR